MAAFEKLAQWKKDLEVWNKALGGTRWALNLRRDPRDASSLRRFMILAADFNNGQWRKLPRLRRLKLLAKGVLLWNWDEVAHRQLLVIVNATGIAFFPLPGSPKPLPKTANPDTSDIGRKCISAVSNGDASLLFFLLPHFDNAGAKALGEVPNGHGDEFSLLPVSIMMEQIPQRKSSMAPTRSPRMTWKRMTVRRSTRAAIRTPMPIDLLGRRIGEGLPLHSLFPLLCILFIMVVEL